MADYRVDLTGVAELTHGLDLVADGLFETDELLPAARRVAARAAAIAPRRTGRLARQIRAREGRSSVSVVAYAPYAQYQEFGTSQMRANPFLRPAAIAEEAAIERAMDRTVDNAIWKAAI